MWGAPRPGHWAHAIGFGVIGRISSWISSISIGQGLMRALLCSSSLCSLRQNYIDSSIVLEIGVDHRLKPK